ncbi:hypothetical protein MWH28_12380 [Natroniella sulfidigena]|uniref:hypothetical protein n=1 Tax=Natroniella sulfidigena TaxID=723921 RepID=UPI00200B6BF3|nr:hypothetical protein [Natroniella sulfidigena]MCK8818154.1 hypothetical protein [Natroniella sulfidigena]
MIEVGDLVRIEDQLEDLTYEVTYVIEQRATLKARELPLTTIVPLSCLTKAEKVNDLWS